MNTKKKKLILAGVAGMCVFSLLFISSCDNTNTNENGKAKLTVNLIDSPAAYDEVNIDIQDVKFSMGDTDTSFVSLEGVKKGVYNLLELTGGIEAVLANTEIPSGYLNQIRLVLGDQNTVLVNGELQKLTIPSGSESGLKIKVGLDLIDGQAYDIKLDFDAARSIHQTGNSGKYLMKPVIRAIIGDSNLGGIVGKVDPVIASNVITILGNDSISTYTNDLGNFIIAGLATGKYKVIVAPTVEMAFTELIFENVKIKADSVTNMGTIQLK